MAELIERHNGAPLEQGQHLRARPEAPIRILASDKVKGTIYMIILCNVEGKNSRYPSASGVGPTRC
jgi:hypothetical protein